MQYKKMLLVSFVILIIGLTAVSAADSDNTATTDNSGSDVAVDSSSSTSQTTETPTHTDSSVDKTSDASTTSFSSQKTDVTSQSTTQKVSEKTSENTQTTSDTTAKDSSDTTSKVSSDTSSQSTQSTSQSQSNSNTTNENTNTVTQQIANTTKSISTDDNITSEASTVHTITPSNVGDLDDIIAECSPGDILRFQGTFSGVDIIIYSNLTITSTYNSKFTDSTVYLTEGSDGATVSNLFINNSNTDRIDVIMMDYDVKNVNISNNTFIINTTRECTSLINLNSSDYSTVCNNTLILSAPTKMIDWVGFEGTPDTYGVGIFNSSYVNVTNNTIECYSTNSNDSFSTIMGVVIQGSTSSSTNATNNRIESNKITVQDKRYAYGIALHFNANSNQIYNNNITSINEDGLYAAGIELEFASNQNSLLGNNIILDVPDTAYGIVFTGESYDILHNNVINSNTINVTSDRSRGVELYYVTNCYVHSSTIIVNGNYTEGICCGATQGSNIYNNIIQVNGVYTNKTKDIDEIPLVNTGIYLTESAFNNTTTVNPSEYDNIYNNKIYSYGNSTVYLDSNYITVTNNSLTLDRGSSKIYGDDSVFNNGARNTIANNTGYTLSGSILEEETSAATHIVTQDNYQEYFIQKTDTSDGGFTDIVNDGDVLDFQGTINLTNNESFIINKAVNITSTTGDALICLNTQSGSLLGEDQGACFVVNNGGSYSNITNVNFWGTQLWITNTSYVVFDNISAIVNGTRVGSGVGQTSIRAGCEYITIKNSYFYTAGNGGSSSLVIAGANYCTLDNNTVETEGDCGNMIYLTTYNTDLEGIDVYNSYNNITNNHLICNDGGVSIRWGIVLTGTDNNVINNTIDYPGGTGITQQFQYTTTNNTKIINNTCINCADSLLPENSTVYGNTFSEVEISAGSTFYNNTLNSIKVTGEGCIITNNTILSDLTLNATNNLIENNTFNGENISINLTAGNNTLKNNQITGNTSILLNGNSIVLEDNVIEGNVQINITGSNNTLKNQEVSGSASFNLDGDSNIIANNSATKTEIANSYLTIDGSDNIVENNTIYRVTNDITIITDSTISINANSNNNIVRYNDIVYYDLFRGTYSTGDDCVSVAENTTGNIVQNNYGDISNVTLPTDDNNYTYITKNVTSMEELISALEDIKTNGVYTEDTKYVINLQEGTYTVTESITWGNGSGDVKEVIINGNGQTINGNDFTSTFLTIDEGYSISLDNITFTDFTLSNSIYTISNNGNLTITNSSFNNAGIIYTVNSQYTTTNHSPESCTIFNNTNFTQTAIRSNYATVTMIVNSNFYDTDLSSLSIALINNTAGELTFYNNTVNNITAEYCIYSDRQMSSRLNPSTFIEKNTFTNLNCSENEIYYRTMHNSIMSTGDKNTLMNNIFINGCNLSYNLIGNSNNNLVELHLNNSYINCSIPVTMSNIPNNSVTTEDFTTTLTLTADSKYGASIDGQIIVYINGTEYKTFDVVNGESNITIENSALNLADNNIEVKYVSPNNGFENTSTTFTITLTEDMIIRIPEGTLYSGDQITLTTQVAVNGSITKDGYVIFKVNGKTVRDENGNPIMVQVDENGMASLNYTIPDTNSNEYNITAVYSGSEGIVRTNTTLTTTLKTATITVEQITAKAGQTVTLRAYITDQNGNAVTTGKLIFKLNGKTLKDANGNTLYATIVNGVATLNYTIPDNYSAKDYILTAVYQGTGFERAEANSTLTLTKSTPTIVPDSTVFGSNNTITINQGTESVNIKATIIDPETNAPINTTTVVTIKINDKTVTQEYVSDGQIDMTIYTSSFANPTYNITVVVGENSQYERTSLNGTLEIVATSSLANETSYNGTLLVKED